MKYVDKLYKHWSGAVIPGCKTSYPWLCWLQNVWHLQAFIHTAKLYESLSGLVKELNPATCLSFIGFDDRPSGQWPSKTGTVRGRTLIAANLDQWSSTLHDLPSDHIPGLLTTKCLTSTSICSHGTVRLITRNWAQVMRTSAVWQRYNTPSVCPSYYLSAHLSFCPPVCPSVRPLARHLSVHVVSSGRPWGTGYEQWRHTLYGKGTCNTLSACLSALRIVSNLHK